MKYYIQRELNEYGPYTLADLQRYVAQGSILPTDLTRSEGMTEWTPVSQVIGNIPIPLAAGTAAGAGGTVGVVTAKAQPVKVAAETPIHYRLSATVKAPAQTTATK